MAPISRKAFLRSLTAISAAASAAPWARVASANEPPLTERSDNPPKDTASQLADRVLDDSARMLCGALSYIGDRLDLFKSMSELGACTPAELAKRARCNERLIAEWLKAMMAYAYVEYLPGDSQFRLSPEQAQVLADEQSPFFMGGMLQTMVPQVMATQEVMKSFISGIPITPDVFHADLWEGIDRANATVYRHQLVQAWLPTMPGVLDKLKTGGKAVDVGCGQGNAVLVLAQSFPNSKFVGFDPHRLSIEKARQSARAAGVSDRTEFFVGSAEELPACQFDLATSFLTMHHMSHPIRDLTAIRNALKPTGSYLIREDNLSDKLQDHVTPLARLSYAASVMACLHDSMSDGGAALGPLTQVRIAQFVREAGFSKFRRLACDSAYDALYEAKL